jgi:hypothetical protein
VGLCLYCRSCIEGKDHMFFAYGFGRRIWREVANQPYPTKKFYTAPPFFSKLNHCSLYTSQMPPIFPRHHHVGQVGRWCKSAKGQAVTCQKSNNSHRYQEPQSSNLRSPPSSKDFPGNIPCDLQEWILLERQRGCRRRFCHVRGAWVGCFSELVWISGCDETVRKKKK